MRVSKRKCECGAWCFGYYKQGVGFISPIFCPRCGEPMYEGLIKESERKNNE